MRKTYIHLLLISVIFGVLLTSCNGGGNTQRSSVVDVNAEGSLFADDKTVRSPFADTVVTISNREGLVVYDVPESQIVVKTDAAQLIDDCTAFVCSAAFTSPSGTVCGNCFLDGLLYVRNSKDGNITGGFIWEGYHSGFSPHHQWGFYMGGYEPELSQRVKDGSVMSAFAQNMIVYHGVRQSMAWRMHNGKYDVFKYRALCEAGDNLYVVESEKAMPYDQFVDRLVNLNVRHALYLDMGSYNYMWCRPIVHRAQSEHDDISIIVDDKSANVNKISNWICFYYVN